MTDAESPETTAGGAVGQVIGKAKVAVGSLLGNADLQREGNLQQAQVEAEIDAERETQAAELRDQEAASRSNASRRPPNATACGPNSRPKTERNAFTKTHPSASTRSRRRPQTNRPLFDIRRKQDFVTPTRPMPWPCSDGLRTRQPPRIGTTSARG